jgi:ADP-ribosylglycohydrolase
MIGAIIGDIVGSPYESLHSPQVDSEDFEPLFSSLSKFTDDTLLTVATADAILDWAERDHTQFEYPRFAQKYKEWARKYPNLGYGSAFREWFVSDEEYVNKSYGNGCMMRCSPIALACKSHPKMLEMARQSTLFTHESPESVRGTQSIVTAIRMGLEGNNKLQIRATVEEQFGHMLYDSLENVRERWPKDTIRCNLTCPQSLIAFMNSSNFETAIRNGVYSRGDTDTIAAIAGSIAEGFYGAKSIPQTFIDEAKKRLTPEIISVVNRFYSLLEALGEKNYEGFRI